MVGSEVEHRQSVEAQQTCDEDEDDGVVDDDPLIGPRYEPRHVQRACGYGCGTERKHNVLGQSLSVGEFNRVAETSAVLHRIVEVYPHGDDCHEYHDREHRPRHHAPLYGEQQQYAQREFHSRQKDRSRQDGPVGKNSVERERFQIVCDFVLCAQRVDGLHVS